MKRFHALQMTVQGPSIVSDNEKSKQIRTTNTKVKQTYNLLQNIY